MKEKNEIPRLSRLAAILILFQTKKILTAQAIADKFEISTRTAYRDIKALEMAGVPIYVEEGKGYRLLEGYMLPPVMFTEAEANALVTAEQLIAQNKDSSLIKDHRAAIDKIKSVLQYRNKEKINLLEQRVFFVQNYQRQITSDYLATVQLAITNFTLLEIQYKALYNQALTQRVIEAKALYHTQGNWILIAWCRLKNDFREFRLDQIQKISALTEQFSGQDFDLAEYFEDKIKKSKL